MKKNILILGGLGFIGSNLIEEFLTYPDEYNLFAFEFSGVPNPFGNKIKAIFGDFHNEDDLEHVFRENQIDIVIHLISTTVPSTSNDNIVYDVEANLLPTIRLLKLMELYKVNNIVFLSSGGTVYGITDSEKVNEEHSTHPISSYGVVKLAIEKYIQLYHRLCGLNYMILRVGNPYGPHQKSEKQGIINIFLRKTMKGEKLTIRGDGSAVRDYLFVKDLAVVVRKLLENNIRNEIINIGSGTRITINEIIKRIEELNGEIHTEYVEPLKSDVPGIVLDNTKLKSYIDHQFIDIDAGIKLSYDYLRNVKVKESSKK